MIPPYVERLHRPAVIIEPKVFSEMVDHAYTIVPKSAVGVHLKALWEEMMRFDVEKNGLYNRKVGIWEDFKANLENLVESDPEKYQLERGTIHWPVNVEFGIMKGDKAFCYLSIDHKEKKEE